MFDVRRVGGTRFRANSMLRWLYGGSHLAVLTLRRNTNASACMSRQRSCVQLGYSSPRIPRSTLPPARTPSPRPRLRVRDGSEGHGGRPRSLPFCRTDAGQLIEQPSSVLNQLLQLARRPVACGQLRRRLQRAAGGEASVRELAGGAAQLPPSAAAAAGAAGAWLGAGARLRLLGCCLRAAGVSGLLFRPPLAIVGAARLRPLGPARLEVERNGTIRCTRVGATALHQWLGAAACRPGAR